MELTATRLRELMTYDPHTGIFEWRKLVGRRKNPAGCIDDKGYRIIRIAGRNHKAHRLAILYVQGRWPVGDTDHANGDRSDNRLVNLRAATRAENQRLTQPPPKLTWPSSPARKSRR
jgi:hypothetical protein